MSRLDSPYNPISYLTNNSLKLMHVCAFVQQMSRVVFAVRLKVQTPEREIIAIGLMALIRVK